jgi:hypothetical protein
MTDEQKAQIVAAWEVHKAKHPVELADEWDAVAYKAHSKSLTDIGHLFLSLLESSH